MIAVLASPNLGRPSGELKCFLLLPCKYQLPAQMQIALRTPHKMTYNLYREKPSVCRSVASLQSTRRQRSLQDRREEELWPGPRQARRSSHS